MFKSKQILTATCASILTTTSSLAFAQEEEPIDLVTWDQTELYQGWRAEQFLDVEVRNENDEDIGEIENIIIGTDGKIQRIIVEAGGFLDIGDTHFGVDWSDVQISPDLEYVTIPLTGENYSEFSVFEEGAAPTGPRAWRVTELLGDYVELKDVANYGYVNDLIFADDGQLQAVVVTPDVNYGMRGDYAYPYRGYDYGYEPGSNIYRLPYGRSEIENLKPFDYEALKK